LLINNELLKENLLKITFTSTHKQFFLPTFALFIDILKTFIYKNIAKSKIDIDVFKNGVYVLYTVHENSSKNISFSKESLRDRLKLSKRQFNNIINGLMRVDFIMILKSKSEEKIMLTAKGEVYLKELFDNFTVEDFAKIEMKSLESKIETIEIEKHPFLGFMIADENGKQILVSEIFDGVFGSLFKSEDSDTFFDYELIPLFINALEKFSDKINIKNLIGFTLKGTNIKIQTFKYEFITVTLFMRHDTAFKSMKSHINNWFKNIFEKNKNRFKECIETGNLELILDLKIEGREWLENLNKKYRVMDLDLNIFDEKLTKDLFQKLDDFSKENSLRSPRFLRRIKKLKQNLIKAALEEDLNSVKEISKKINALNFIE
jgi:predicted transcriptional regulator